MSWIILIFQLILFFALYFVYDYLKKLPEQVHQKNLETFKNELQKEIVKLNISEGNLHIRRLEKYIQFTNLLNIAISGVKNKENPKTLERKMNEAMEVFTADLIFFAGEKTIHKFVEYRNYSRVVTKGGENEKAKFQYIVAELLLEMRRDLGYEDKNITADHYMNIIVNDWEEHREEFERKASKAKTLV